MYDSCHGRTQRECPYGRKMKRIKRTKVILYLFGAFIVAQAAAQTSQESLADETDAVFAFAIDPKLQKRMHAFKESGAEKTISTSDYDIEGVIEYAMSLLGTPHVMGGYSPSGLDCSGLVSLAHAQAGVALPRSSHDQGRYGVIVPTGEELQRGDLVFFHSTYKKPHLITHAGIYLGDNKFIHTSTSRGVSISTLFDSGYWQHHYLFATRLKSEGLRPAL